ncbi:hypothetical protein OAE79_01665, partial [Rhodopirellula sp.]
PRKQAKLRTGKGSQFFRGTASTAMQALHSFRNIFWQHALTAILLALCLSLSAQDLFAQISFNPQPAPAGANSGFPAANQPASPQTNLTPVNPSANTWSGGNNSTAFDPYAINSQGMVPAPATPSAAGGSAAFPSTPQTLPGAGLAAPNFSNNGNASVQGGSAITPSTPGLSSIGTPTVSGQTGNTIGGYPNYNPAPANRRGLFGLFSLPASSTTAYGTPNTLNNPSVYGANGPASMNGGPAPNASYGPNGSAYPNSIYPQNSPNTLFPEGFGSAYSGGLLRNPSTSYDSSRLLQGPRFRYTYVSPGSKPEHLGINDFDTSLAFALPNFLNFNQPLYVVPSFSLHLWDGPVGTTGADLPSKAYDAFVDLGWDSDPNKIFSTDFGLRLGVFSDFDTYTDRSFRIRARALMNFRLTPTTTFKGGIYYVNRNEIKLIPAAGLIYRPDPYTRLDLYFPKPKFARYYRTLGTYDLWWYITGDYGGGNWTITRTNGAEDSVDINDLRAILGLEWGPSQSLAQGRRSGFAEIGYVFNREVLYRTQQADNFNPDDAFVFRVGIGY